MRVWLKCIFLVLLSATLWAQTAKPQTPTGTKSPKKTQAKRAPSVSAEVKQLREAVDAQQQQIQQLREELQKRDAALQQVQQQVSTLQTTATQAQSTAQTAATTSQQNTTALNQVQTSVADLKSASTTTTASVQKSEKRLGDLENPASIHYKGITITPGGFVAAYGIYRSHNTGSDATSTFGGIPFSGTSNAHLSEFRFTTRHSNINVMAQGKVRGIKTTGYFEIDFEGAAPTANEVITNSFTPRIREFWANVELNNGFSVLGGQEWALIVPNRKGIAPKGEFRPATIDASYLVGYHYSRETMFRVTQKVNDHFTVAFAVENPETVTQGNGASVANVVAGVQGTGFAAPVSTDLAPDLSAKIALDPGWGHFELAGVGRFFRSRVVPTAGVPDGGTNNTNLGGGLAFNAILPLVPKKVDFIVNTLAGRGVGRFLPGGGVDVIVKPDGSLQPVKAAGVMAGFETHPIPTFDFNIYAGNEYYDRTVYLNASGKQVGYGVTTADLRGCAVERAPTGRLCESANRDIWEITPVIWHRIYRGKEGTLQWGLQYQYIHRRVWRGNGALTGSPSTGLAPVGINNVVMTALRWYFP